MDVFREIRYIIHLFFIILLCWLGWLCSLAFGQVAEAFTGAANFSNIELTCLGNSAALFRLLFRGEPWCKDQAELGLASRKSEKLNNINGLEVLTTCREKLQECSVVILSSQMPITRSMRLLMRYISNIYHVHSISLQYRPLQSVPVRDTLMYSEVMPCIHGHKCRCIVFNTVEDITVMLARRMPGILKRLSDSVSLLPSQRCLSNGCHGCNQGLLHVENDKLREGYRQLGFPSAVCEILDVDVESIHTVGTCICIPVRSANEDDWTKRLISFFQPRDNELRGAVIRNGRTNASSALQNYINGNGECNIADEKYKVASLFIVPRLSKLFIKLVLTFWLNVDGFSGSLFATAALQNFISQKDYLFSPHVFLSRSLVKSNANKTNVCQVLFCAGAPQYMALSYSLDHWITIICITFWVVLVGTDVDPTNWYHKHYLAPSTARVPVILVGVCIALVMDGVDLSLYLKIRRMRRFRSSDHWINPLLICGIIVLEIVYIVMCSLMAQGYGYGYGYGQVGRWICSALQILSAVKWEIGAFLISETYPYSLSEDPLKSEELNWWYGSCGLYISSSAILLNAILAGGRAKWNFEL